MTTISGCRGGDPTVDKAAEKGLFGGKRGCSYRQSNGLAAEGGNELLPSARRKRYSGVVGKQYPTDREGCVSKMWEGSADTGPHSVLVWEG